MTAVVAGIALTLVAVGCGGGENGGAAREPDSDLVAFASNRDGDFDVYVMDVRGGGVTNLTRNAASAESEADDNGPAWSPDGSWIAFTSTRDHEGDGLASVEVYVMRADGSDQRRLTENALPEFEPRWLPDGRVSYVTCRDALSTCRRVAGGLAADDVETIATDPEAVFAAPSPDGARIAYVGPRRANWFDERPGDVYVANADGSNAVRLTETPDAYEAAVAWSPDGERIAFVTDRDRNGPCLFHDCVGYASEVYVMRADGSDVRRLTDSPGDDGFPSWSPDGRRIVFGRIRDERDDWELYVMNADGTCQTRLTENDAWDWTPAWSGDGEGKLSC